MINYILMAIYLVLMIIWIALLLMNSQKAKAMLDPLDPKKYALKAIYSIGFNFLEIIHYSYNTAFDKKRLVQAKIVYGAKYGEYYYRINVIEKISYTITCVVLSPLLKVKCVELITMAPYCANPELVTFTVTVLFKTLGELNVIISVWST